MNRRTLAGIAVALLIGACGTGPTPVPTSPPSSPTPLPTSSALPTSAPTASPTPTSAPSPGQLATTRLNLVAKVHETCGSIGGCATYVALIPAGAATVVELPLTGGGEGGPRLPEVIGPGSWIVRFRLAAVSDDQTTGSPPDETTIATCELPIEVFRQSAVNISVVFLRDSCSVTGTYSVTIID